MPELIRPMVHGPCGTYGARDTCQVCPRLAPGVGRDSCQVRPGRKPDICQVCLCILSCTEEAQFRVKFPPRKANEAIQSGRRCKKTPGESRAGPHTRTQALGPRTAPNGSENARGNRHSRWMHVYHQTQQTHLDRLPAPLGRALARRQHALNLKGCKRGPGQTGSHDKAKKHFK